MKKLTYYFPVVLIVLLYWGCATNNTASIYISLNGDDANPGTIEDPILSLGAAIKKIDDIKQNTEFKFIEIILREGVYELPSTFVLDGENNLDGSLKITIKAHNQEDVVISGGKKLSNWEVGVDGKWIAKLNEDDYFEQLYVNGRSATRARTPNRTSDKSQWFLKRADFDQDDTRRITRLDILLRDAALENFGSLTYGDIIVMKDWATFRKQIDYIEPDKQLVHIKLPVTKPAKLYGESNSLYSYNRQPGYSVYLEGHPSMVDEDGEWALDIDNNKIIYKPLPGETIENSVTYYPVLSKLILISGTKTRPIRDIHFQGISFSHTGYWLPPNGHDGTQAAMFYHGDKMDIHDEEQVITEAVRLEYARNCSFTNCTFSMIGSSGFRLAEGCKNITISYNEFYEIGGNCLMSGLKKDPASDSASMVSNIRILRNQIKQGGRIYPSGVGIWLGYCHSHQVIGNTISDLPYTGISVGWQWNPLPSSSGNNLIENNHIHHVVKALGDGGGIFTLGKQPGSILRKNLIHNIEKSQFSHGAPNNGIFIASGSQDYVVEGNLIYDVAGAPIRGHRSAGVFINDNVFITNEGQPGVTHSPPYGNPIIIFDNETISWLRPESLQVSHYNDTINAMFLKGNTFLKMESNPEIQAIKDKLGI